MSNFFFLHTTKNEKIDETIESKYVWFQAKVGHEKEFEVALRRLRGKDADVSKEATEIQVLPFINHEKKHPIERPWR